MKKHRPLKCVFYALNGTGLGHITRQTHIARDMQALCHAIGIDEEFTILTTSDAPQVANGFLTHKLPSKTTAKSLGMSLKDFNARARLQIGNLLSGLNPDVLVVDTEPRGSFKELGLYAGMANSRVLIDRHKDDAFMNIRSVALARGTYDLVLAPEDSLADEDGEKRFSVGKIQGFLPEHALPATLAREHFGVRESEILIYLSAGGGGDPTAEAKLSETIMALSGMSQVVVVVGYGPLYTGEIWRKSRNVIPVQEVGLSKYFAGFDLAISAAGYNSHEELLAAGVPTLFYAQKKGMDRQDLRIANSVSHGYCEDITELEVANLPSHIEELFMDGRHNQIREALQSRSFPMGNVRAAEKILALALSKAPYSLPAGTVPLAARSLEQARNEMRQKLFQDLALEVPA